MICSKYEEKCDVYMCNVCDTESCNSWGVSSMPDQRAYSAAASANHVSWMAFVVLLLLNAGIRRVQQMRAH